MPDLSGMSPVTIQMTDTLLQLVQGIKPNQIYRAVVSETPQGSLTVNINGARIALPQGTTLTAGQAVTVERSVKSGASQMLIRPEAPPPTSAPKPPDPMIILKQIMQELPSLIAMAPEQATALVPSVLPSSDAILRMALQILQFQSRLPEAVETLTRSLRQHAANTPPDSTTTTLLALLGSDIKLDEPESILQFLKLLQKHSQRPPLANMASRATSSMPAITTSDTHLYQLLSSLRNDQSILDTFESATDLKTFRSAVETLMEHTAGQHLQNARALEIPYTYINLPITNETIQHAQIHILGEGRGYQEWGDGDTGQIVLDLDTSKLGSMWIHLRHSPEQCTCQFDVASEEIAAHINEAASTLEARLEGISFKHVIVKATVWDGDRMAAISSLLQHYTGLDLKA